MNDHDHPHDGPPEPALPPETPVDAGSQALAEALRSSFAIVKVVMVLLVLVFLGLRASSPSGPRSGRSCCALARRVGEGEKALLLPGLHWSFPYPIDEHIKVSIGGLQQVSSTVGWYAVTPEQDAGGHRTAGGRHAQSRRGWLRPDGRCQHHSHPRHPDLPHQRTRFATCSVSSTPRMPCRTPLDNALLYAASRFKVDDILTRDMAGFQEAVRRRVTQLVETAGLGHRRRAMRGRRASRRGS